MLESILAIVKKVGKNGRDQKSIEKMTESKIFSFKKTTESKRLVKIFQKRSKKMAKSEI